MGTSTSYTHTHTHTHTHNALVHRQVSITGPYRHRQVASGSHDTGITTVSLVCGGANGIGSAAAEGRAVFFLGWASRSTTVDRILGLRHPTTAFLD